MSEPNKRRRVRVDGVDAGEAEAIPRGSSSSRGSSGSHGSKGERTGTPEDPMLAFAAHLMDSFFRVPGTQVRFGLDPLIGFVPGVGDGAGVAVSAALIGLSARYGLPKIVVARMAMNVLINSLVGLIPGVGDAFSFWFKSNQRNYALFQQHAGKGRVSTKGDWLFVGGILFGLLSVIIGAILLWWSVIYLVAKQIGLI